MAQLPSYAISHSRKVCNLYRRCLKHIKTCYLHPGLEWRYLSVVVRDRFDRCKDITDLRVAKMLMLKATQELDEERHYDELKFAHSPGGCSYERYLDAPDWVLDYWHPIEKAQYPKYFACREQRKIEYQKFYEQQYGNGEPPCAPDNNEET